MTDGDLALSILTKMGADWMTSLLVERGKDGEGGSIVIDSGWTDATAEEIALLRRLFVHY